MDSTGANVVDPHDIQGRLQQAGKPGQPSSNTRA
jgi:hypothetical protein